MIEKSTDREKASGLNSYPIGDTPSIARILLVITIVVVMMLAILLIFFLAANLYDEALTVTISAIPVLTATLVTRRGKVSVATGILALTMIVMVTYLAAIGQGMHDFGLLAYPVILIAAGLIVRGKTILYMAGLIILCLGWLVFGEILGLYTPQPVSFPVPQEFLIMATTIVVTALAVRLLSENMFANLERAQQEIQEREQAERRLQTLARELEARNGELDSFAHTVAHDLKNPLAISVGYAESLEDGDADLTASEQRRLLRSIAARARKLGNITDELLLLAGVREMQVQIGPLDMGVIVAEAHRRLKNMITIAQAVISLPESWPAALGHAPWVEKVWVNLVSIAVKYGGQPPRLELGGEVQPEGTVRFWVRDNGRGLTEQDQARLFIPFTRLDQVRALGHGLGLSIVRRIVEKLDRQVGVTGQVGQGSTFFFTLPGVTG
jgi:signal transduction histidine kinase